MGLAANLTNFMKQKKSNGSDVNDKGAHIIHQFKRGALSLFKTRSQSILLIDWDGLRAKAFILERIANQWHIRCQIETQAGKPTQLMQKIVDGLQERQQSIPKSAMLVTQTVLFDVLELPIADPKKLDKSRIHDMLKWEVEPLLADYYSTWNLEKVLVGLGYLTIETVLSMSEEIQQARIKVRTEGGSMPLSLGATCVQAGLLTDEQLAVATELQEYWQLRETSKFKLHFQIDNSTSSSNDYEAENTRFLFNVLDTQIRNEWFSLLSGCGCELLNVFSPLSGLIKKLPNTAIVFNSIDGLLQAKRSTSGELQIIRQGWQQEKIAVNLSDAHWFGALECEHALGEDCSCGSPWLAEQLKEYLNHDFDLSEVFKHGPALYLALQDRKWQSTVLSVPARNPLPPIYQQAIFYKVGMVFLGVGIILFLELNSNYQLSYLENETNRLYVDLEKKEERNDIIETANQDLRQKLEKVAEQEQLNIKFEKEFATLQEIVRDRRSANLNLLNMFTRSVPDDVYLLSIIEDEWHSYEVKGWGLNEESIREFASRLVTISEEHSMRLLKSPSTHAALGYNDLPGYKFEFRIYRAHKKDAEVLRQSLSEADQS